MTSSAQAAPPERPRLLVCDDSPTIRNVIRQLLAPNHEVHAVASAEEALAQAIPFQPDLIISDLLMQGMDGYALCRQVREQPGLKNVPFILLTSQTDDDSRVLGLEAGANDYLVKPIRPRELLVRVASLLKLSNATLALERRTRELEEANATLRKAQSVLVQQEKLASLGQLVAGIAHELNNPINFCHGNVQFLQEYVQALLKCVDGAFALPGLTEAQRSRLAELAQQADLEFIRADVMKIISSIQLGTQRSADIVRDMLAFARVGTGRMEEVNLASALEMALTVLGHELRERIRVNREFLVQPRVRADPSKLGQVLVNLLMNAIQAIEGKGDITISLHQENGLAYCSIRDNGCGMTQEVRSRIFDPFFSTKPEGKGTGLGLSISYSIIEQHGGRIEVESAPGRGTTVTLVLPLQGPTGA